MKKMEKIKKNVLLLKDCQVRVGREAKVGEFIKNNTVGLVEPQPES
jgi:hypothetical protein